MKMDKISKGDPTVKSKEDQWRNSIKSIKQNLCQNFHRLF